MNGQSKLTALTLRQLGARAFFELSSHNLIGETIY